MEKKNQKPDVIFTKPIFADPVEPENTFDWLYEHQKALVDKDVKRKDQRSKAGKAPKRRQAIFQFVKNQYEQNKHLSGQQLYLLIRKTYPHYKPYRDIQGNVIYYDIGRLFQCNPDDKVQGISYSTYQSYLTEIRKNQK